MHDITELEKLGVPGLFVASTEFVEAAAAQGRALGFHPAAVFIPHPIQDRTDAEMHALARAAVAEITQALTSTG